jgi:hypothetical protein
VILPPLVFLAPSVRLGYKRKKDLAYYSKV